MNRGEQEKIAAGGIIRDRQGRVLLVHRPKYDDWSFPKGKLEPGETIEQGAIREVREETGLECRIVRRLGTQRYQYRTKAGKLRPKVVHYFLMELSPESSSDQIRADGVEIDRVEWLAPEDAAERLSYEDDCDLLELVLASRG